MSTRPAGPRARALAAAAIAAVALGAAAAPAHAASGHATLALNGAGAKALRAAGARIAPFGAATGGSRQVVVPIRAGLVGSTATVLRFGGGIVLRNGDRRARLGALRLTLGPRTGLAGKVGGKNMGVFRVLPGGRRTIDATRGSVRLENLRLKLTRPAAQLLAKQLHLADPSSPRPQKPGLCTGFCGLGGVFGVLSGFDEGLATGEAPAADQGPEQSGCPLPSGAGPAPESPLPVAARPAGAVDVTAATLSWDVRDSFVRYVNSGEGTSVFGGATAGPSEVRAGTSLPLTYTFGFPFAGGWHDSGADPGPADDRAAIYFGGGVRFLYSDHEIDLRTGAPEIELAGTSSRAIFAVAEGEAAAERQVIVNLDLGRAAAVSTAAGAVTYERVPGAIPAGTASSVFGGFYAPGTDFGCFTVSYSTAS